jgi:hypothetical protein
MLRDEEVLGRNLSPAMNTRSFDNVLKRRVKFDLMGRRKRLMLHPGMIEVRVGIA